MKTIHGLLQKARIDASTTPYRIFPGGKGFRIWLIDGGSSFVAEVVHREDAEDFLVGKLCQEDR